MSPDDDRARERPEDGRDAERQAAAWEDIVQRLRADDPPGGHAASPTGAPQDHRPGGAGPADHGPAVGGPEDEPGHAWRSWRPADDGEAEDPEQDWQPADPGDVTAGMRPGTLIAWVLLLGVGAVMIVLGFVLRGLPGWLWVPGLAIMLGCLISLFQSLPEQRGDDDDGARV